MNNPNAVDCGVNAPQTNLFLTNLNNEIIDLLEDSDPETVDTLQCMYLGWLESGMSDGLPKNKRVRYYYLIYNICRIISKYNTTK